MSACEKCWGDAYMRSLSDISKSQGEHYIDLLNERKYSPCTAKEQAGMFWDDENNCDSRERE